MSFGPQSVFTQTMAASSLVSPQFDLGRSWKSVYLEVPTMPSSTNILVYGASETGGTFRQVMHPALNSATVAINPFVIASSVSNCFAPIPACTRFIKVQFSSAVTSVAVRLNVVCSD